MLGRDDESSSGSGRLAIVEPSLAGVLRNRSALIAAARQRGHEVLVLAPSQLSGEVAALHALGGVHRTFDLVPQGLSVLAPSRLMRQLREKLTAWRPHTVLVSSSRLAGVAAHAAKKSGAGRIVTLVNDLGGRTDADRKAALAAYDRAIRFSHAIVCHNADDLLAVRAAAKIAQQTRCIVVPGTGIDVADFKDVPELAADGPVVFLMVADPDAREAIGAYATAAQALARRGIPAKCLLATDREAAHDTTILTVSGVEFLGRAADTRAVLAKAHVAVHLSADDGAPVALREAMASARPLITIDRPGCREAVDERVNGCKVPPGNPDALLAAMESFHVHRDLMRAEGRASRAKAETAFATGPALATYLDALGL